MTINYLAVLMCGVAAMVIGFIWYGPLFGKAFMKIMGAESMSPEQKKAMKKSMGGMYFIQFILALITAGVLDYHILNWTTPASTVGIAICTWFGFVMTTEAGSTLWSGKPKKMAWRLFFISAGGQLVTFIVFGLILGAWHAQEISRMIGYIGLVLLLIGYILLDTKHEKLFAPVNCIASIILMIHAWLIHDVPFIIVNGFVAIMLAIRFYQQTRKKKSHGTD